MMLSTDTTIGATGTYICNCLHLTNLLNGRAQGLRFAWGPSVSRTVILYGAKLRERSLYQNLGLNP
jgi:hypothetical protein